MHTRITSLIITALVIVTACTDGSKILNPLVNPQTDFDGFEGPIPDLDANLLSAFFRGDAAFEGAFSAEDGLGPVFNQTSCEGCHAADGKAPLSAAITFFGRGTGESFDPLVALGGPKLLERGTFFQPGNPLPPEATAISQRLGPVVSGRGFMAAIPEQTILGWADEFDSDGDGISGRPNWVDTRYIGAAPGPQLGRFGHKAGAFNLLEQIAEAFLTDMGLTSGARPVEYVDARQGDVVRDNVPDPEVPDQMMADVVIYIATLRLPNRGPVTGDVLAGETLFRTLNCAGCHIPEVTTGSFTLATGTEDVFVSALSNRTVNLYTDMLLHDMGPGLADGFVEFTATGSEFRTTPLYGLRGVFHFLHDGRARTLREAIDWHGGEAENARNAFLALSDRDQEQLLIFLRSL